MSARSMTFAALRWFARGGSHLNFYMWWGGYNRGRAAAGGITNMYALESPLCPSGEPREPKFSSFQRLVSAIVRVAPVLLQAPSALDRPESPEVRQKDGAWTKSNHTLAFRYQSDNEEVVFVENISDSALQVRNISANASLVFSLDSYSAILVVNDQVVFNSASDNQIPTRLERWTTTIPSDLVQNHRSWSEVLCISDVAKHSLQARHPVEQTELNTIKNNVWSDYAIYHVGFHLEDEVAKDASLQIESVEAMAFTVHLDGMHVSSIDTHKHTEGLLVYSVSVPASILHIGDHNLVIVSESLGYANLVGRWGSGTTAKTKGIIGNVMLLRPTSFLDKNRTIANLTDGTHVWNSVPGLSFDPSVALQQNYVQLNMDNAAEAGQSVRIGRWTEFYFETPLYNHSLETLYVDIRQGRGHFWLNGLDLGRYWNITEDGRDVNETDCRLSQSYYHLPHDLLWPRSAGTLNRLVIFDGLNFGIRDDPTTMRLVTSHVGPSSGDGSSIFPDQVGFDLACLR